MSQLNNNTQLNFENLNSKKNEVAREKTKNSNNEFVKPGFLLTPKNSVSDIDYTKSTLIKTDEAKLIEMNKNLNINKKPIGEKFNKNDQTSVLQAKSIAFPIKIRPSYEIYSIETNHITNSLEKRNSPLKNKTTKLPNLTQKPAQTYLTFDLLPNYLKPQKYLEPSNISTTFRSSPMFAYKRYKKNQSNSNPKILNKNSNTREIEEKNKFITYGHNISQTTDYEDRILKDYESKIKNYKESNKNSLPLLTKTYSANDFSLGLVNHDNQDSISKGDNSIEHSQIFNLTEDVESQINDIVKDYPSIVLRRQGLKRFPKYRDYITDNRIKYEISSVENQSGTLNENTLLSMDLNNINYGNIL